MSNVTTRIAPIDIRIGDSILSTFISASPTIVRTIEIHANDSIMPHVLINGIRTIGLRGTIDVIR